MGKPITITRTQVFTDLKEDQWDRKETTNFKDMGAVKGTAVRDLADLLGGMAPGDEIMIKYR